MFTRRQIKSLIKIITTAIGAAVAVLLGVGDF